MQRKTETLDFVLFGPKRDISGLSIHQTNYPAMYFRYLCFSSNFIPLDLIRVSEHRALSYAIRENETRNYVEESTFTAIDSFAKHQHNEKKYSLVCYYVIPSRSSPRDRLQPSDIDPQLCSHIIIFFASIEENSINFTDTQVSFCAITFGILPCTRNFFQTKNFCLRVE